ncbi:MAG: hypothetical protein QE285_14460 [Aquabacterium sp.]|nr:hypothetical protein [Aquabacterium sp.]
MRARSLRVLLGSCLLVVMLLPAVRQVAEARMLTHMLLQYPALLLAGALLVPAVPARLRRAVQRFNSLGLAGLLGVALGMAVLMVPKVLDLALANPWVEAAKLLALLFSGAALALSWRRAGTVMQAFFLGNLLPMLAVVGSLYQESPLRLCNAYRLDDQQALGSALHAVAAGVLVLWLLQLGLGLRRLRRLRPAAV